MKLLLRQQARRHEGTEARRVHIASLASSRRRLRRAFSLIEVLLAIFILGVGVISIAALFPAGIAQQRQSVDDIMGPTVANNALSILRSKIRPEDFGALDDFVPNIYVLDPLTTGVRATIRGDWSWMRPGFMFGDDGTTLAVNEQGAIDIFSGAPTFYGSGGVPYATEFDGGLATSTWTPALAGIPFNTRLYATAPRFVFTRNERFYPMIAQNGAIDQGRPQYVWDCMFRRFQGKILVAIFVYRATIPGSVNALYSVAQNPNATFAAVPPIPVRISLLDPAMATWSADGPWKLGGPDGNINTVDDNAFVHGTQAGTPFDPENQPESWQDPRQWILDQNNNVHRVLGVSRLDDDQANPMDIELTRPIADVAGVPVMYFPPMPPNPAGSLVSDIWYIPLTDGQGYTLTPVYVTVKEL